MLLTLAQIRLVPTKRAHHQPDSFSSSNSRVALSASSVVIASIYAFIESQCHNCPRVAKKAYCIFCLSYAIVSGNHKHGKNSWSPKCITMKIKVCQECSSNMVCTTEILTSSVLATTMWWVNMPLGLEEGVGTTQKNFLGGRVGKYGTHFAATWSDSTTPIATIKPPWKDQSN